MDCSNPSGSRPEGFSVLPNRHLAVFRSSGFPGWGRFRSRQARLCAIDMIFIVIGLYIPHIAMENKVNDPTAPMESALDLLGRRWALRIVWELRRDRLSFSDLSQRLAISPSVLTSRLRELVQADICEVEPNGRGYSLTGRGRELARILYEVNRWASAGSAGPSASMLTP